MTSRAPPAERPRRVLIIDDDASAIERWRTGLLERHPSVDVLAMATGRALRYVQELAETPPKAPRPDLILLRLNSDSKDDERTLTALKSAEELRSIPVIAWPASASDDVNRAYQLGANAVLRSDDVPTEPVTRFWLGTAELPP